MLREETGLPVHLWDERLTTSEAHRYLHASGVAGANLKKVVDQVVPVLILQGYLDGMANRADDKRTGIGVV
jgi:putative Holliday junction resolvase